MPLTGVITINYLINNDPPPPPPPALPQHFSHSILTRSTPVQNISAPRPSIQPQHFNPPPPPQALLSKAFQSSPSLPQSHSKAPNQKTNNFLFFQLCDILTNLIFLENIHKLLQNNNEMHSCCSLAHVIRMTWKLLCCFFSHSFNTKIQNLLTSMISHAHTSLHTYVH